MSGGVTVVRLWSGIVLLAGMLSCDGGGGLFEPQAGLLVWSGEDVRVEAYGCQGLVSVENSRSGPIDFDIVDPDGLLDWEPCAHGCTHPIQPGSLSGRQFDFFGPPPARIEWALMWWDFEPMGNGQLPGRVRQINLTFSC